MNDIKMVVVNSEKLNKTGEIMMNRQVLKHLKKVNVMQGVPVYTNGHNYYFAANNETTQVLAKLKGWKKCY